MLLKGDLLCQALAFTKLGMKSLSGMNTLAYWANSQEGSVVKMAPGSYPVREDWVIYLGNF